MRVTEATPGGVKVPPQVHNKTNKTHSVKIQGGVFPVDLPLDNTLLTTLRSIAVSNLTLRQRKFQSIDLISSVDTVIDEFKQNDSDIDNITKKLANDFVEGKMCLHCLLQKKLKPAKDTQERTIILRMLLILGDGFSDFFTTVFQNGEKDSRYSYCVDFVRALDAAALEKFISKAFFISKKKLNNLAKGLFDVAEQDLVLDILEKKVAKKMAKETFSAGPVDKVISLLIAAQKNYKGDLPLSRLIWPFKVALSWDSVTEASRAIIQRMGKHGAAQFFRNYALNTEDFDELDFNSRDSAITNYAFLLKEFAVDGISEFVIKPVNPVLLTSACTALLLDGGEKGAKLLEDLIVKAVENKIPSKVLATVVLNSRDSFCYGKLLRRIFSKDLDWVDALKQIANSDMEVVVPVRKWSYHKPITPTFSNLIRSIGFKEWRLIDWMIKAEDVNLRQNARKLMLAAIQNDSSTKRVRKELDELLLLNGEDSQSLRKWIGMQ